MKKTFIAIASILAIVAGCSKNDPQTKASDGKIYATIEDIASTKATLYGDGQAQAFYMVWQASDAISLFDGVSNIQCTLSSEAGKKYGEFNPASTPASAAKYYALYPYQADATVSAGAMTVSFPDAITYVNNNGSAESGANIMVAEATGTDIKFKNLCSYISFTIKGTSGQVVKSIIIEGEDDQAVAGKGTVTFTEGVPSFAFGTADVKKAVTVSFGDGWDLKSDLPFAAALAPVFEKGFEITVCLANGLTQEFESKTAIARNDMVLLPEITVTAKAVAQIGTAVYSSLDDAVDAANVAAEDVTVKMIGNAEVDYVVDFENENNKIITLDLNGCTITNIGTTTNTLRVKAGQIVINDSSAEKNGTVKGVHSAVRLDGGAATINGGNFEGDGAADGGTGVVYASGDKLIINGGTITCNGTSGGRAINAKATGSPEINGGTIICNDASGWALRIYNTGTGVVDGANVVIYSCSTTSEPVCAASSGTKIEFKNGYVYSDGGKGIGTDSKVTFTGGHFNKAVTVGTGYQCVASTVTGPDGRSYTYEVKAK